MDIDYNETHLETPSEGVELFEIVVEETPKSDNKRRAENYVKDKAKRKELSNVIFKLGLLSPSTRIKEDHLHDIIRGILQSLDIAYDFEMRPFLSWFRFSYSKRMKVHQLPFNARKAYKYAKLYDPEKYPEMAMKTLSVPQDLFEKMKSISLTATQSNLTSRQLLKRIIGKKALRKTILEIFTKIEYFPESDLEDAEEDVLSS